MFEHAGKPWYLLTAILPARGDQGRIRFTRDARENARRLGRPAPLIFEGRFGRISDLRECWARFPERPLVPRQVVRQSL